MNFTKETAYSEALSTTHNSMYSSSSLSQATPPSQSSTPTAICSVPITAPISVPPLRPKKILSSFSGQEFASQPTTPPPPPPQQQPTMNFKPNGVNECNFPNGLNRQRLGYIGGNVMPPLNNISAAHCNLLSNQNQLLLRQQQFINHQILQEQQKQKEYAAATIAKQQFVLSAAGVANHPQDEIANSLKMFAVLSACKSNETPPSPDDVMQDFAANGYTTDEFHRYQQYQQAAAANHMQSYIANSNVFSHNHQHLNQCLDYNMNLPNGGGGGNSSYINWLYNQQLLNESAAYNGLLRQNFANMLHQKQFIQQAETAYVAAAAAAINMDYNSQNLRPKKTHFKKESQLTIRRCVFCENNNEPEAVVKSHAVRDSQGRVLCPKLRIYVCPICGASGDDAHTVKYCPQKPIVTMEDAIKAESNRFAKANFLQKQQPSQMHA